jgi:hypothetical protein
MDSAEALASWGSIRRIQTTPQKARSNGEFVRSNKMAAEPIFEIAQTVAESRLANILIASAARSQAAML